MGVEFTDEGIAMNSLCGLPYEFEHLIVAVDYLADDKSFTLDFVKA